MNRTNSSRAVFLIVFWSVAVHLPGILSPLRDYHAFRQCQTASMARNYYRHGMNFLNPELDTNGRPTRAGTEFPVYSYLLAGVYKLTGVQEIFGRILSIFFGAWGALFLYGFVKRRLGERNALCSALVMCSIPVHVYFTRSVQPEPMALWGLLGFLYFADRWLYIDHKAGSWFMMIILGALAPLLKLPFLYILGPLWFCLGVQRYGRAFFGKIRYWLAFILMLGATAAWYRYAKTAPTTILPLTMKDHLANLAPIWTLRLWRAQFISRIPELVTTYSGLLFALIGAYYFRKAKSFKFFVAWLVISFLYVPLLGEYGLIHRYTLLPLAPIAAVWIACGITTVWEYAKNHTLMIPLAIVLIAGIPVHSTLRINHWYKLDYPYVTRAHDALAKVAKPEDLVLVASHETPEILYYLDHYGYAVEPKSWTAEAVSTILHHGVRFVLLPEEDNRESLTQWQGYLKTRAHLVTQDKEFLLYRIP